MEISYDPTKNAKNLAMGRPSLEEVVGFDFSTAVIVEDVRHDYPERRFVAAGYLLDDRLHVLCFTPTATGIRAISFRKANKREVRKHENTR